MFLDRLWFVIACLLSVIIWVSEAIYIKLVNFLSSLQVKVEKLKIGILKFRFLKDGVRIIEFRIVKFRIIDDALYKQIITHLLQYVGWNPSFWDGIIFMAYWDLTTFLIEIFPFLRPISILFDPQYPFD